MKSLRFSIPLSLALCLSLAGCKSHYQMTGIERSRILIDSRYDQQPDEEAAQFMKSFQEVVDSLMNPVVGETAEFMDVSRPESKLSNLAADILVWASKKFNEKPDFAVYNMGGIRAALPAGPITKGDVLDMAPFENKICFLTLSGEKVLQLFSEMVARGGEAVSHGVEIEMSRDRKLLSARLNGKPIDPKASYRIVTLDYVAQGNDGMTAFKSKTQVVSPQEEENNVRYLIMAYFQEKQKQGQKVSATVEGRITVK